MELTKNTRPRNPAVTIELLPMTAQLTRPTALAGLILLKHARRVVSTLSRSAGNAHHNSYYYNTCKLVSNKSAIAKIENQQAASANRCAVADQNFVAKIPARPPVRHRNVVCAANFPTSKRLSVVAWATNNDVSRYKWLTAGVLELVAVAGVARLALPYLLLERPTRSYLRRSAIKHCNRRRPDN